jgi:hypothetical protein
VTFGRRATNRADRAMPNPSAEDQRDPVFLAIFNVIKGWDIRTESDSGYSGGNGSHVMMILKAVRSELALELAIIEMHKR